MQLPPELSFIAPLLVKPSELYRKVNWLLSDFDDVIWTYSFDFDEPKHLDWNIQLDDGSNLTDRKNEKLLLGLKYYLTSTTRITSGYHDDTNSRDQQLREFRSTCHVIDYLLIHSKRYQLAKYGLEGLTTGNLIEILEAISSNPLISEAIYEWNKRLTRYCLDLLSKTDQKDIQIILEQHPNISIVTPEQQHSNNLEIPLDLIPPIRACLFLKGIYYTNKPYGRHYSSLPITQEIYKNTLWGRIQAKPVHPILCYNEASSLFEREYPPAPVTSDPSATMRSVTYAVYRRVLYGMGMLHEIGLPAPTIEALVKAEEFEPNITETGRYRSLSSELVFSSIRNAIEFHLDYGTPLIESFCRISIECKSRGLSPATLTQEEIKSLMSPEILALGVNRLSLSIRPKGTGHNRLGVKGDKEEYYTNLRNNVGLYELLSVYIGCVQLVTGVLAARRVSEMYSLPADGCLDSTGEWLIFSLAKSTRHLFGMRRMESRPIEPIAVDMIKNLIKMQKILKRVGYLHKLHRLFSVPHLKGAATLTDCSVHVYNRNLDLFCDYFEIPLNSAGERPYFRQHQLRRFFAMLFFYCGSFAKIDTLRWMLGQTDPQHVYRYIKESTEGSVLAGPKAHYVAEQLHQGNIENFVELAGLLKDKYGTDDFSLIDTNDLEDQILDLMKEGWVEIEPEFFTDNFGKHFKVIARLIRTKEAE